MKNTKNIRTYKQKNMETLKQTINNCKKKEKTVKTQKKTFKKQKINLKNLRQTQKK